MEEVKFEKILPDLLFLLAISALSLTWFRGDNLINVGDFCFPLDRKVYLSVSTFLWDHSISMGYPAAGQLGSIFPYSLLGVLTDWIGLSLVSFEKLMFFLWFSISGLGMYAFCAESGLSRPARLFAALFYMMNPYSLLVPWHLASGLLIAGYSMTPPLMFLLTRMLRTGRFSDWGWMFLAWFVCGTYSYMNPVVGVVHLLLFGSFSAFHVLLSLRKGLPVGRTILLIVLLFLAWGLASSYWVIPFVKGIAAQSAAASNATMAFASNLETFSMNSAPLSENLRLQGLWSMHESWRPWTPYYAWAKAYKEPFFILLGFLPPFLLLGGLVLAEKRAYAFLFYFTSLLLATLFMMKGAYPPLESINFWMNSHLPFFGTAFRAGYQKWGLMASFAFCCLAGYGAGAVIEHSHTKSGKWAWAVGAALGVLLFVVYMFPFWNGQVIFSGGGIIPSARAKVPESYSELYAWTKAQPGEFRIFSLPLSRNSNSIYKWEDGGYSGADFIRFFSAKPVIYANYGFYYDLPLYIGEKIQARSYEGLLPLFSLLNARYLLLHGDINWTAIKELNWWVNKDKKALADYFASEKGLRLEKEVGQLKLYRLPTAYDSPQFYTAAKPVVYSGGIQGLVHKLGPVAAAGPRLFIDEADAGRIRLHGNGGKLPAKIVFRRINSARYEVSVQGASGPFWLVMGETFHPGWKLFKGGLKAPGGGAHPLITYPRYNSAEGDHGNSPSFRDLFYAWRAPLDVPHFPANTFANAWYVDPDANKLGGDFAVDVFFLPQAAVYLGLLTAVGLIAISLALAVAPLLRRKPVAGGEHE
ncbi:MAG: hypothetical protein A2049_05000 [Elusimicrobia bacterium GWA2_62_23]|nr:MAG: hypothetical protein A2049_05000 [Elusimicrobia bacterium GWA2_62_23]HBB66166.1 hypothetical protein [Elusimicrobiota bacterium]